MTYRSLLLVLALFLPAGSEDEAPCPTCAGEGFLEQDCFSCEGTGELDCRTCGREVEMLRVRDRDESLSLEQLIVLRGLREAVYGEDSELGLLSGRPEPGRVRCPAKCTNSLPLTVFREPCAQCARAGHVDCPDCDASPGRVPCVRCEARKVRKRACSDCNGRGALALPTAAQTETAGTCTWCEGTGKRVCVDAEDDHTPLARCRDCGADGVASCGDCAGLGDRACRTCFGEGKVKPDPEKRRTKRCKPCKGKGRIDCATCEEGEVRCDPCDRSGVLPQPCATCDGDGFQPCSGCWRSARRWTCWC